MIFVFHIYHAPSVLASSDRTTVGDDVFLGPNNGEGDKVFHSGVYGAFFFIMFIIVVGKHAEVVKSEFFLDALFEGVTLFESERVRFGDDRNYVDNVGEFLEYNNVNWFKAAGRS